MFYKKNIIVFLIFIFMLFCMPVSYSEEFSASAVKYPDYANLYLGKDKFEGFNRKIFNFNLRLNKYIIRPVHIVWASIMPMYGMDRISGITHNIEYPIRLMSTLIQRDFPAAKTETIRFFTNTTIGLCGMFDPAKKLLKIEPVEENMEQALAKCKIKPGCYLVIPFISSTSPRNILGRILDTALNPSSYVASPAIAIAKSVILINRTYYMQPLIQMLESTYADPYDIAKKMYGLENYIKCANLDRMDFLSKWLEKINKPTTEGKENNNIEEKQVSTNKAVASDIPQRDKDNEINLSEFLQGNATQTDIILHRNRKHALENLKLVPDIVLSNYNPQTPVTDSMRTSLFNVPKMSSTVWADLSIWNRGFYKKLKTSSISLTQGRENYKYRYILQKNPTSPIAVIYPSIGEGIMSTHSAMFAKIFYDEGYSVLIMGSHFQWEFVKSMPENYRPGIPSVDADYMKEATDKIINDLQIKYNCEFNGKIVLGTSFGAMMTLFVAQKEFDPNLEEQPSKYIAICPPIDLFYAMEQVDKNTEEWSKCGEELKNKVALTAAKVIQVINKKDNINTQNILLPFTDEEVKLITGFIMHQKLSDLVFTLENVTNAPHSDIYDRINSMNYCDYVNKYLSGETNGNTKEIAHKANLYSLSDYLMNSDNYKIYHSLDDYLTNTKQLRQLKLYTGTKTVLFDHGAHLGFLYRPEFIEQLKKEIVINNSTLVGVK